jgi:hypothetical protein
VRELRWTGGGICTIPSFLRNDPDRALEVLCRGLLIAQDSGNRFTESMLGPNLSRLQPEHGPAGGVRLRLWSSQPPRRGNTTTIRVPFAVLVTLVDPRERYESAVTIADFAFRPLTQRRSLSSAPRSRTIEMCSPARVIR